MSEQQAARILSYQKCMRQQLWFSATPNAEDMQKKKHPQTRHPNTGLILQTNLSSIACNKSPRATRAPIPPNGPHFCRDTARLLGVRSITTSLLPITESAARGFNQRKPPTRPTILALDFSKAFDTVPHPRLLHRVLQSGLHNNIIR